MASQGKAVPKRKQAVDTGADPSTWDWQPIMVRTELKQGKLKRTCNDAFWAFAFVLTMGALIGFAVYGYSVMEWDGKDLMPDSKDGKYEEDFMWRIILQLGLASVCGLVFAFMWTCLLRSCAGCMIKLSIFVFLGLKVAAVAIVGMHLSGQGMMVILGLMALSLLLHGLYFWCIWNRIPMAEATLKIATKVSSKYHAVYWIGLLFSLLTIAFIFTCCFGTFGVYRFCGFEYTFKETMEEKGRTGNWAAYSIFVGSTLALFWGVITLGYIVHAICAGVMGTWYFGVSRKRTTRDAMYRALTLNLGSLSFAGFIVAVVRTLECIARMGDENGEQNIVSVCAECILSLIGDMLDYFNSVAIVRIAVYGETFCTAAKRTMNMFKYRGMKQLINDDLSGMPIWLGCIIIYLLTVPCIFASYKAFGPQLLHKAELGQTEMIYFAFIFALCALFIPVAILNVIPSFVQSLYVLWGDDPKAFDDTHPEEAKMLKQAALDCIGYRVKYDDAKITGHA